MLWEYKQKMRFVLHSFSSLQTLVCKLFLQSFHLFSLALSICLLICLRKSLLKLNPYWNPHGHFSCMTDKEKNKPQILIIEGWLRVDLWVWFGFGAFFSAIISQSHYANENNSRNGMQLLFNGALAIGNQTVHIRKPIIWPSTPKRRCTARPVPRNLHHNPISQPGVLDDASLERFIGIV